MGSKGAHVWVSYQFKKCPCSRCSVIKVANVASRRCSNSCVPIQPNWRAQDTLSKYSPMLVGEVR